MTLPPIWLLLPIAVGAMAVQFAVIVLVLRSQRRTLPIPDWWARVPPFRRRLAYLALLWELIGASILLWSIEPGNELPDAIRVARGPTSWAAWGVLIWVGVTAARTQPS